MERTGVCAAALRRPKLSRFTAVAALVAVAACSDPAEPGPPGESWSFEAGLEGWSVAATDILVGGAPIEWWARPSTALASDGARSIEIYMDNRTDAAKVWLVRSFSVQPNRDYIMHLNFDFASRDYGEINLFQILAGASPTAPVTGAEVLAVARTDVTTGNAAGSDIGFQWSHRYFARAARSSADGKLHVILGVWGTWETPRTYYLDDVSVELVAVGG